MIVQTEGDVFHAVGIVCFVHQVDRSDSHTNFAPGFNLAY